MSPRVYLRRYSSPPGSTVSAWHHRSSRSQT